METTDGGAQRKTRPDEAGDTGRSDDDVRAVRVGYVSRGFGPALTVVDEDDQDPADTESGLLRMSDAVMTLEIPRPDGGRSVLSWDPAEVSLDPLVA